MTRRQADRGGHAIGPRQTVRAVRRPCAPFPRLRRAAAPDWKFKDSADFPRAAASLVEDAAPLCGDPADDPVRSAFDAVFNVIGHAPFWIGRSQIGGNQLFAIVGLQASVEIGHHDRLSGGNAEQIPHALRPRKVAIAGLDIPPANVRDIGRQPQPVVYSR